MTLPVATHSMTVTRNQVGEAVNVDPWDDGPVSGPGPTPLVVGAGIAFVLLEPSGQLAQDGGAREAVTYLFRCDPCGIQRLDTVTDDVTGETYECQWARLRRGPDGDDELEHEVGELKQIRGEI
jgi:hypothetical protein